MNRPYSGGPVSRDYVELWHGAELLFRKGMTGESGAQWLFFSAMLLLSFCLEAFLNFAGPLVFGTIWSEGDRPLNSKDIRAQLKLVAAGCGVDLSQRKKCWKVAENLIDLRQGVAFDVQFEAGPSSPDDDMSRLCRPWGLYGDSKVLQNYQAELKALLASLYEGLPQRPPGDVLSG